MTLSEAKKRVWTCRLLGVIIVVFALLTPMLVLLKHLYLTLPNDPIFYIPGRKLYNFINQILATFPALSFIWALIPLVDVNNMLFYILLMSAMIWIIVGRGIVKYANNINGRIRRARHAIEEERWRQSLGQAPNNAGVLSIQIGSEDRWHEKPNGLLLIGLIVEVIGGLLVLLVGPLLTR